MTVVTTYRRGFTLIELLIVVAIIAILALIAVPNFLEAQVRAKVARAKADLRTIATGVEAYYVDANDYPRNHESLRWTISPDLTTPVAFLSTARFRDPFAHYKENDPLVGLPFYTYHRVMKASEISAGASGLPREHWPPEESTDGPIGQGNPGALYKYGEWRLMSLGPDTAYLPPGWRDLYGGDRQLLYDLIETVYDPTNGTVSFGNISRLPINPDGQARPWPP